MKTNTRLTLATLLVAATLASTARAHHSYAQYDRCRSVSIEGEIERLVWANPHVLVTLATDDAAYRIEWLSLQQLKRDGVATGSIELGDRIRITGSRNRDPDVRIMTLITEIQRASDGWRWSRPARSSAGTCAQS